MKVQFVCNAAGERMAALVPIKEWERLQKLATAQKPATKPSRKEQFKEDFREAVREMQQMQRGEIPKYPLRKFLAELDRENGL